METQGWLIGCGPSLDTFDFSLIPQDAFVLCVNFSALITPKYSGVVCLDTHRGVLLTQTFPKDTVMYTMHPRTLCARHFQIRIVKPVTPGAGCASGAVGLCALNNEGFKIIHMLGFDAYYHITANHSKSLIAKGVYRDEERKLDHLNILNQAMNLVVKERSLELLQEGNNGTTHAK